MLVFLYIVSIFLYHSIDVKEDTNVVSRETCMAVADCDGSYIRTVFCLRWPIGGDGQADAESPLVVALRNRRWYSDGDSGGRSLVASAQGTVRGRSSATG